MFFKEGDLAKSKIFLYACLAFIFGIALAGFLADSWILKGMWWFSGSMFFGLMAIGFWKGRLFLAVLFLLLACTASGVWRYSLALPRDYPDRIWHYNAKPAAFIGRVMDEPDLRENNVKYKIETERVMNNGTWQPAKGIVLVTANTFPSYDYGDRLEFTCGLKKPEPIDNFSYDRYLARYDIYSVCYYPKAKLISEAQFRVMSPGWFYNQVLNLRKGIKNVSNRGMGEPESSLAQAISFGIRQSLPQEIKDQFSQTGLTHIMAVSGMNISILVMVVMHVLLASGLKRKIAFYITTAWIVGFVILVASPASAVRAGLMGFLVLWALNLGRLNKITNTIVLAGAVMLIINPKILRDDLGFQLSFLATLSLVYFYPLFSSWYKEKKIFARVPKLISETLLITLAAQVLTLPILIYNFRFISLSAPLANLLVLWAILPITFFTFFGAVLAFFLPGWPNIIFFPAWLLSKYVIVITKILASIPFSHPKTGYLKWQYLSIYYLILAIYLYKRKKDEISIDFG